MLAYPLTAGSGDPAESVSGRQDFDQPTVEDMLKEDMKASQGWNAAHGAGYQGLTAGIPLVTNIIFTVVDQVWDMTPLGILPFEPSDVLDFISGLPILGSIIPGLDASKIISGSFPLEMIEGLLDVGGKIASSLLEVPLSAITGLLDGGGKIVTDLLSVPTSVITGLLSGGFILTSLIPGLDASKIVSGSFPMSLITGLTGELDDLAEFGQATLNALWEGMFRAAPIGNVLVTDIIDGLQNISPLNIIGVTGGTIVDTFANTIDTLWGGFARLFGATGKSIQDVASQASETVSVANTGLELSEWNNALLGIRNNKSLFSGMDETEESNFLFTEMMTGGTDPPTISATSSSVPMAFWRASEVAKKGVISWVGKGFANITSLFIDIYKFNYDTNTLELLHSSSNQIGQVVAGWTLCQYFMDEADRVDVVNADVLAVAWRVVGTGTHSIGGKLAGTWIPNHPTVVPARFAATRTGVGDLAFGSITYSNDIPWFGIGIIDGDKPPDYHAPRTTQFAESGAYTYDVPDWATHVDEIKIGAGGGGEGGDTITGQTGERGWAGDWHATTLVRGVDFPDTTGVQLTGVIGTRGNGGGAGGVNGTSGTATTRAAISGGAAASSAAGGAGGNGFGSLKVGEAAGNFTYNGVEYPGGAGGSASGGHTGGTGGSPGGGGGGGSGGTWGIAWAGGNGGRGGAWFVARQEL